MSKEKISYWVLAVLLASAFGFAGFLKVSTHPMEIEIFTRFGYPLWLMYVVGVAELAGAFGLIAGRFINTQLPRAGAIGLLVVMVGAIGSHLMYDPLFMMLPAIVLSILLLVFLYASRPVVV